MTASFTATTAGVAAITYYSTTFLWICLFLVLRPSPLSALQLACVVNTVRRDETPQAERLQQQKERRKRNTRLDAQRTFRSKSFNAFETTDNATLVALCLHTVFPSSPHRPLQLQRTDSLHPPRHALRPVVLRTATKETRLSSLRHFYVARS